MTPLRPILGTGLAIMLAWPAAPLLAAPVAKTAPPPATAPAASEVDPQAIQALSRMSAYLGTLTAFAIKATTSLDLVTEDDRLVKLEGVNQYTVRRPDAFVVEIATPWKVRRLIYDGKSLTLYAPELGYYATVAAPPTSRAALAAANERYGLTIPLQDLFRWTDPNWGAPDRIEVATVVGASKIDGVDATQYAFRQENVDWQIWVRNGDQPTPLKVVIIDRLQPTHPQFVAKLDWNLSPQVTSETFAFHPAKGVTAIRLTSLEP